MSTLRGDEDFRRYESKIRADNNWGKVSRMNKSNKRNKKRIPGHGSQRKSPFKSSTRRRQYETTTQKDPSTNNIEAAAQRKELSKIGLDPSREYSPMELAEIK